jgi:hypothetical protein
VRIERTPVLLLDSWAETGCITVEIVGIPNNYQGKPGLPGYFFGNSGRFFWKNFAL